MHDERLSDLIKNAGESIPAPAPDVGAIVRRGRRRRWTARPVAIAASIALVAGGAVAVTRMDFSESRTTSPVAAAPAGLTTWEPMAEAPIEGRAGGISVWTGSELIVWGGQSGAPRGLLDGAAYDPATDTWTRLPRSPLRTSSGRTAVWTGEEMLVWGGEFGDGSHAAPDSGAAYDPAAREWRRLPEAPYWSLAGHVTVWTGTEMIVWGGVTTDGDPAAAYDPATNRWRRIPSGPMGSRHGAAGVWAVDRMIVWGGRSQGPTPVAGPEGAAFDPASGRWTELPEAPLGDVANVVTAWTGVEMVVAGGLSRTEPPKGAAAYDPAAGTWRRIADVPVAPGRDGWPMPLNDIHTTGRWTGEQVVFVTADGIVGYSPEHDEWTRSEAPDAARVGGATTAWTGDALLVWSGRAYDAGDFEDGGWIARD